jgi:hypothetical protein
MVENPFMSRVLVDQYELVVQLNKNIGSKELSNDAKWVSGYLLRLLARGRWLSTERWRGGNGMKRLLADD